MEAFLSWVAGLAEVGRLPEAFQYAFVTRGMLAILLVAPLLGVISHLVVARRLAFFSAALGHAALTGITIGLVLGEPLNGPYGGLFGFCLLCGLSMVYVRRNSSLPPDTLVGVFLALTLGLGICLLVAVTKRFNIHQIEAVMFGSLLTVTDQDLLLLALVTLLVGATLVRNYNRWVFDSLDSRLAAVSGVATGRLEYLFVVMLTLSIVVSLKIIGALLVEALVVVPAAAARNLSRSMVSYVTWSVAMALAACVTGLFISNHWALPTGGAIVLSMSALFFLSLGIGKLFRRN